MGLPSMIPGSERGTVLDWARTAEESGFSTLAVLDRLVHDCWEPLVTLSAAAAVTNRIKLLSSVLIAPYRGDVAVLAKQTATIALLSGGRLTLGMASGFRADDYAMAGTNFHDRGRRLTALADELTAYWSGNRPLSGERVGPKVAPKLAFGGQSEPAIRRAGRHGTAWIAGGSSPVPYETTLEKARSVWERDGVAEPRKIALTYFALGPDAAEHARSYLSRYYAFLGDEFASMIVEKALITPDSVESTVERYREAGCDELVFFPCSNDLDQVTALADVVERTRAAV